jgi:tripartite-type tricarboxylate transporter receptor subunit TctC
MTTSLLRRRAALFTLSALTLAAYGPAAHAQDAAKWPTRTVRLTTPYPTGGAPDTIARVLAEKLSHKWGQSVIVDNKPGGNGFIAIDAFKRGAKDGHDLIQLDSVHIAAYPYLFKKLPYDPAKDFDVQATLWKAYLMFVVPTGSKYKTVGDVIADAKANPGKIDYGSGGNGSPQHVAMALFASTAGIQMQHVPYKGATQAAVGVAGNEVAVAFQGLGTVTPLIQGGKLRLIGVATPQRMAGRDAPTIGESGLPGFTFNSWFALYAPAGTPKALVNRMSEEVRKALADPGVREKLTQQGFTLQGSTPEQLAAATRDQLAKYQKLMKEAGIKAE